MTAVLFDGAVPVRVAPVIAVRADGGGVPAKAQPW